MKLIQKNISELLFINLYIILILLYDEISRIYFALN